MGAYIIFRRILQIWFTVNLIWFGLKMNLTCNSSDKKQKKNQLGKMRIWYFEIFDVFAWKENLWWELERLSQSWLSILIGNSEILTLNRISSGVKIENNCKKLSLITQAALGWIKRFVGRFRLRLSVKLLKYILKLSRSIF